MLVELVSLNHEGAEQENPEFLMVGVVMEDIQMIMKYILSINLGSVLEGELSPPFLTSFHQIKSLVQYLDFGLIPCICS